MAPEKSGKPTAGGSGALLGGCKEGHMHPAPGTELMGGFLVAGGGVGWGMSLSLAFLQTLMQPSLFWDPVSPLLCLHLSLSPPERTEKNQ